MIINNSMATNIYKYHIYKYPKLVELALNGTGFLINPDYFNPHIKFSDIIKNPNNIYPYYISLNPSNKAIEFLNKNPKYIDISGLGQNNNPKCVHILDILSSHFLEDHWQIMAESHHLQIMELLEKHPEKIDWSRLSMNTCEGAISILNKNPEKIVWDILSANPSAIEILKAYTDKIVWKELCKNPNAIEMIEQMLIKNPENINFWTLSMNPNAIHILSKHLDKASTYYLLENPNAVSICIKHPEMISDSMSFKAFCSNINAINYIEENMDKFVFDRLSIINLTQNPNGISLVQKLWDKGMISQVNMKYLADTFLIFNKSTYELDYQTMSKERSQLIYSELISKALHPSRVDKWLEYHLENGGCCEDFDWV